MKRIAWSLTITLLPLLTGCGKAVSPGTYTDIPTIKDGSSTSSSTAKEEAPKEGAMCAYWNSLPNETTTSFRILESVSVGTDTQVFNGVTTKVLMGVHNLGNLPQARYFPLSIDYAEGQPPVQPLPARDPAVCCSLFCLSQKPVANQVSARPACAEVKTGRPTPLDPPDVETFMHIAKDQHDCGQVSDLQWTGLKALYCAAKSSGTAKKTLIQTRNSEVVKMAEQQLPGGFTGTPGPLTNKATLTYLFQASADIPVLTPDHLGPMKLLTRKVDLFPKGGWAARRADMAQEMLLLSTFASSRTLPMEERACRFALQQRVSAQLLSLKGIKGAPALKPTGFLQDYPETDVADFPKVNEIGTFGVVASKPWIEAQVANPTLRPAGTSATSELIEAARYFTEASAHRTTDVYTLLDSRGNAQVPAGTVQLDPQLLQLGVGFFGMTAGVFKAQDLTATDDGQVHLKDDTADNLARTGLLAMEAVDAFKGLYYPTPLDLQNLTDSQIKSFTDDYPVGAVKSFQMLVYGVVFEGIDRSNKGVGSPMLDDTLRKIGDWIGNEKLRQWGQLN
ncbi:MAG: hypothetical protein JST16_19130 [Bdellovibrionales bacterium]|nr:hypothetical protein [Bdellovibrionales bacterium]